MNLHYQNHITIGLAGKRHHKNLNVAEAKLNMLFEAFDEKIKNCHIHFITGLADGGDQIAAATFFKFYEPVIAAKESSMGAIIPFTALEYRQTLGDKAKHDDKPKKHFDDLYGKCTQKIELDGMFSDDPDSELLTKAYLQQALVLGRTSDILIAIAPKSDAGKKGGTMNTLVFVLSLKKPVIFLNLDDKQFYLYQSLEEWFEETKPCDPSDIVETLFPVAFEVRIENKKDDPEDEKSIFRLRKWVWQKFEKRYKGEKDGSSVPEKPISGPFHQELLAIRKYFDETADQKQYQYRGGYVLNYVLALIAIGLAVLSLMIYSLRVNIGEYTHWVLIFVGFCKMLILATLFYNTWEINKNKHNRKAIDSRYVAERLRVNCFMSVLGVLRSPLPAPGNHSKRHFAQYQGEKNYQQEMYLPLRNPFTIIMTKEKLLDFLKDLKTELVASQVRYHATESGRMKIMDERLQKKPELLSLIILIIVGFDVLAAFFIELAPELFHFTVCPALKCSFDRAVPLLLALTAFIPAIITTFNGIHFQTESRRLAIRSKLMAEELGTHDQIIDRAYTEIENSTDGSNFYTVFNIMDNVANVLTDEVAEWSLIYEKRVYDQ